MNTIEKVALGAGACVLAGVVGYCAYRYYETKKSASIEEDEEDWESESDEEAKVPLYDLMDNVLLEGINALLIIGNRLEESKAQSEYSEEALAQMKAYLEQNFAAIEQRVCEDNDWNIAEYMEEVERRQGNNDEEVIRRINFVEEAIDDVLKNKKPKIEFKFDPKLTPENTLMLYSWIIMVHGYSMHKEIRRLVASGDNLRMNTEELNELITKAVDRTRENRR